MPDQPIHYIRCRFHARIPRDRRYTASHYWAQETAPGLWRIGLTPWALRMLGELVEYHFDTPDSAEVALGQTLGFVEAFKAVADIYAVGTGTFAGVNPLLPTNLDAVAQDSYGTGWLYMIKGSIDPECLDAAAYVALLDQTIDQIRGAQP